MTSLRTERLLLRPLCRDDLEHLQYALRPEFYRYLPIPVQTQQTLANFLEQQLVQQPGEKANWTFGIELMEVRHVIGTVRITIQSRGHKAADMGYALNSDFYGHGYATEAARAVLNFGFKELGMHRIWATADVRNQASWRVLERIGMKREALLRHDKLIRGEWRDSYLYAILEGELMGAV